MNRIILDLCGGTGSWSKPYRDAGYDVRLVTLPEQDVRLYVPPDNVWGILAAPPCEHFSFAKHFHGKGKYSHDFDTGMSIVNACLSIVEKCKPQWWALENPFGYLRKFIGEPKHSFDPWQYGDMHQKRTDLWGEFAMPEPSVKSKPEGIVKFSMLKSKDIVPDQYGIRRHEGTKEHWGLALNLSGLPLFFRIH